MTARLTAASLLLVTTSSLAAQTVQYDVVDLGSTKQHSTLCPCFFAQGSNDMGGTAGFFFGADGTYNAFIETGQGMIDLSPPGENMTFARAINDQGHAVGWTDVFAPQHAWLWDGASFIDLGTLGGTYSDAHDINNLGQIVGSASTPFPEDDSHAAIWQRGAWTDLGTLGGVFSEALAINDGGLIVGWSWNAAWDAKAVYWNADLTGPNELPSLPESGPLHFSYANGLNEAGQIVGQVELDPIDLPRYRAVLWENGAVIDLGLLPEAGQGQNIYGAVPHVSTIARDINESGVIVGMSTPESHEPDRPGPWVWRDGVMTNLNDLVTDASWTITDVVSISNDGVLAASGRLAGNNHSHALRLVPVTSIPGDLSGDGVVDVIDLVMLLGSWGPCPDCEADLDGDGVVAVADLLILIAHWG